MKHSERLAWAAGLFEGEGCFYFNHRTGQMGAMVGSTDRDVLETFRRAVGVGAIYARSSRAAHYKPQWYWQANRLIETVALYERIGPLLHRRRRERYGECHALREAYEAERPLVRHRVSLLKGTKP